MQTFVGLVTFAGEENCVTSSKNVCVGGYPQRGFIAHPNIEFAPTELAPNDTFYFDFAFAFIGLKNEK